MYICPDPSTKYSSRLLTVLFYISQRADAGAGANGRGGQNQKPCNAKVDVVFAMDTLESLWLAKDSIRFYETNLLPSRQARFGVVLCGELKSFYTELHNDFRGQ